MNYKCLCGKIYKTERGYKNHLKNKKCNINSSPISSQPSSTQSSLNVSPTPELVKENKDLLNKLIPKKIEEEVKDIKEEIIDDDDVAYNKSNFIMKDVYMKKMKYLQKQLFKSKLPVKRIRAYKSMMRKLKNKIVLE